MAFSSFGSFHSLTSRNKIKASSSSSSSFSSSSISGLRVWFDAADPYGTGSLPANGAGISTWTDKAGNGYNATAYGTAGAYSLSNKSIIFTGSTFYTTNYPANPTSESVFVVFRQSSNAVGAAMVSSNPGGRALATYNPSTSFGIINASVAWGAVISNALPTQGATYLGEGFFSGTNTYASVNGNLTITGPTTVPAYTSGTLTQLGFQNTTAAPNGQFYGNIMEILIYNSNMQASATDRQKIEGYLAWKWGIQTSLPSSHPYYSAAPTFTLTAPSAPTSVSAAVASSTSATVTFTPPSGTVTSYTVTSSPGSISVSGSSSPITVTGLTTGTAYTFTVTATNSAGTSSASTASSSITPVSPPSAPTAVSATVASSTSASIAFTPPSGTVTSYTVTSSPGSISATGSSSPITVTGLTAGTAYTFTVTATNAGGTSSASTASSSITCGLFTKTSISGLQLWYDAADPSGNGSIPSNGESISKWTDKAGNGYDATAVTAGTYNLSGKSIAFNGSAYYTTTYPANPTNESIFIVFSQSQTSNNGYPIGATNFGRQVGMENSTTPSGWGILSANRAWSTKVGGLGGVGVSNLGEAFVGSSTNTYVSVNGNLTITGPNTIASTTFNSGTTTCLGRQISSADGLFYGNIMEILIYNSNMQASATTRQKIEGYLAWKWGIQTSLPSSHPYYSAAPTF